MNSGAKVILESWTEAVSESDKADDSNFPSGTTVSQEPG
jgi:hypothetical protein